MKNEGYEGSHPTNSLLCMDVPSQKFSWVQTEGSLPPERSQHASTLLDKYMVIHGGEGKPRRIEQQDQSYYGKYL